MFRSTNGVQGMGGLIMLLGWKFPVMQKYSASDMQIVESLLLKMELHHNGSQSLYRQVITFIQTYCL